MCPRALPRLAALVVVGILAGCGSSNDSAAKRSPVLKAECGKPAPRPSEIVLTCADGGMRLTGLMWGTWGGKVATGSGTIAVRGCDPSCAADNRTYSYAVNVSAHQVVTCPNGTRQYAFIEYSVTDGDTDSHRPNDGTQGYNC